jgi:rhodanese-related sulfurtransferase
MLRVNPFKIGLLLVASVVLGLANGWLNPHRPAWSEEVLLEGEIRLTDVMSAASPVLWVDARSSKDYEAGKIPSAIPLNEDQWDELLPEFLSVWQPSMRVVVYCSSQKCRASHEVAQRLKSEMGLSEVYVLKGGWEAWLARNE